MVYVVWHLLYFLFPRPSLAGPLYTASLPAIVLDSIPRCAQSCVKDFVAREFSSSGCGPTQDLGCLCRSDSASGSTLGEGAYLCFSTGCPDQGIGEATVVYRICQSIKNAKPMTHKAITTTLFDSIGPFSPERTHTTCERTPSSSSLRASKTKTPTLSAACNSTPKYTPNKSEILSSTHSTKMPTLPPTTSSTLPSPTAIASNAPKPALAKGSIAGIAIGGVACIAGAIGLLVFVFCIRRRHSNRKRLSGSSFGNDKIINSNPPSPGFFSPRDEVSEQVQYVSPQSVPTRTLESEQTRQIAFHQVERQHGFVTPERKSRNETTTGRRRLHPDEIGLALGSETRGRLAVDEPPTSAASYRTTSNLLPDKPSYSLYPSPSRPQNPRSPVGPINSPLPGEAGIGQKGPMPLLRPSPRLGNSPEPDQLRSQRGFPPMHASASDPFLDRHPGSQALAYINPRRQRLRLEMPSSNRPDPQILQHGQWTQSLDDLPKPVAARHSSSARELNRQKSALASISPNDYRGRALFQPPADRSTQVRREGQRIKGTNRFRLSTARYSSASETNFEDTDDEEPIPPMPTSYHFILPNQSSGDVASSRAQGSATPLQFGQRPIPTSPTPNPARRNQRLAIPLSLHNVSGSKRMSIRKPLPPVPELPGVPELPDSPVNATVQGRRERSALPRNRSRATDDVRRTAKWQILVSPGLTGIDSSSIPLAKGGGVGKPATASKPVAARTPTPPSRRN